MFIIEYFYDRFLRFKQHHDTVYKVWCQLPTDAVLEDQYKRSLVDQVCFCGTDITWMCLNSRTVVR